MSPRVVFVCSGNICRSPTAEVVLRAQAAAAGAEIDVASAGTGDWHAGQDMDRRSRATLDAAGYRAGDHLARQFRTEDFAAADLVVALDSTHLTQLRELADRSDDPAGNRAKLVLLREFDPQLAPGEAPEVGDPYYGGPDGFSDVLAQIERSCRALLADLPRRFG